MAYLQRQAEAEPHAADDLAARLVSGFKKSCAAPRPTIR
jgi:hypothetical protein